MVALFDLELEPQTELEMVTKITKLWRVSRPLFPFHFGLKFYSKMAFLNNSELLCLGHT